MSGSPEEQLRRCMEEARASAGAGLSPYACAETLFENAVTPLSKLRAMPLDAVQTALVGEAVSVMLDLGRHLFDDDRYAARKLGDILSWARHFAGPQGDEPTWQQMFENLQRDWQWQSR